MTKPKKQTDPKPGSEIHTGVFMMKVHIPFLKSYEDLIAYANAKKKSAPQVLAEFVVAQEKAAKKQMEVAHAGK